MTDTQYMNVILRRLGVNTDEVKAAPGQSIGPTFYVAFTTIIDRLDALEARPNVNAASGDLS